MSKFIKSFLLLVLLIGLCTNCALAATYPCEGQVLKSAVNVRKKANQGSDQVGKLKRDEIVTVVGEERSGNTVWYRIEFGNGNTGYVRGDLIALSDSKTKTEKTSETKTQSQVTPQPNKNTNKKIAPTASPVPNSYYIGKAITAVQRTKNSLKNPESLQVHSIRLKRRNNEEFIVIDFSAMNGFGGYGREEDIYKVNGLVKANNAEVSLLTYATSFSSLNVNEVMTWVNSNQPYVPPINNSNTSKQAASNNAESKPTPTPTPTLIPTPVVTVNEEILFRGIPWGVSASEFAELTNADGMRGRFSDIGPIPQSWEKKGRIWVTGAGHHYYAYTDELVAGIPVEEIWAIFAHDTDGINVYRDMNENKLYYVQYEFKPLDKKAAFSLLKEKLNTLYGEGIEESFDEGNDSYSDTVTWYGINKTGVRLQYYYSLKKDGSVFSDWLTLQYGKTNSIETLKNVQEALLREEAKKLSSDKSTDGL